VIAVLLWLFITNESVIIRQQSIPGVRLNAINIAPGLTASCPNEIRVSIVGTPRAAREIYAYVDLKNKGAGIHRVKVKVRPMPGTRVLSITPAEVKVKIDEIQEFVFPVSYKIDRSPPEGFTVAGVEVTPTKCVVRGGQTEVNRVSTLTTFLDLSSLRDTAAIRTKVIALDRDGQPLDRVQVVPEQVQAYVVIEKSQTISKVTVNASLTGNLPEQYQVERVVIEPTEVTLIGSELDLSGISSVSTRPIDLTGRDRPFQIEVELAPIAGVSIFPSKVMVMIEVSGKAERT